MIPRLPVAVATTPLDPGWALLVLVVVLLLAGAAALRWPRLRGTLTVMVTGARSRDVGGEVDLHRRVHRLSADGTGDGRLDVPGADVRITTRGVRTRNGRVIRVRVQVRPRPVGEVAGPVRTASTDLPEEGRRLVLGLEFQHGYGSVLPEATTGSTTVRMHR